MLQRNYRFTLIELLGCDGDHWDSRVNRYSTICKRGYEATLKSDLRNAATAEEAYFAQAKTYKSVHSLPALPQDVTGARRLALCNRRSGQIVSAYRHALNCSGISWTYNSARGVTTGPAC